MAFLLGIFILYLGFSTGRGLFSLVRLQIPPQEECLLATALGLGVLAYATLLTGLAGLLTPLFLWFMIALLAVRAFLSLVADLSVLKASLPPFDLPRKFSDRFILAAGFIAFASVCAGVLAPETANDSLCYHLNLPKIYLMNARISTIPFDVNSEFPFFMEMLYTLGLGLHGMALAKFFHFASGFLLAAAAGLFVYRHTARLKYGLMSALLLLTTPVILNQLSTTYVDAALALYSFLALICLIWAFDDQPNKRGLVVWAGVFAGFAMSIKYLALISIVFFAAFIWMKQFKRPAKCAKGLLAFGGFVFLAGSYWYLRSYVLTGNPVYPYFASVFKSGDAAIHYNDVGVSKTLLNFLTVFWTITMKPHLFEGFSVQIGPAYLAFLPIAAAAGWKNSHLRWLCAYAVYFLGAWFMLGQSMRFLVPLLPVLAAVIGIGFGSIPEGTPKKYLSFLFAAILAYHALLAVFHYRHDFAAASGFQTQESYLLKYERSYRTARFVNESLASDVKILNADEAHMFYFKRPMIRESSYVTDGEQYWENAASLEEVLSRLKAAGFTHILYSTRSNLRPSDGSEKSIPVLLAQPENRIATGLKALYTDRFTDSQNVTTEYFLYEII